MRIIFCLLLLLINCPVYSQDQVPRSIAGNPHIKTLNYSPNSIHKYIGFYGQQSSIVFEAGEVISTFSMGVSSGWQLEAKGNRLFIKPISDNADTNATIITNKRVYHFQLYAQEAEGINDPAIAYEVRFRYPSNNITFNKNFVEDDGVLTERSDIPDISNATNLNFDYLLKGVDHIKPIRVFDDGRFTYLEFEKENANLPAVFLVGSDGYESLINFRVRGNYMIVERVAAKFTLRYGQDTVCVTNTKIPFYYKQP